ncbi:hypothetical protein SELMODRAFT_179045 [Selaginella moellendorffii]|uniref:DUF985 domain-containing protein n=1 Tax=Selaginella moellendorffii TaxID=88036 RepID=D8SEL3_SELML|nr:hypothetical protein SELMODRAFT_179045 [Selaginella moellendorffii]
MSSVKELQELLSLTPHPEGGFFCESFRDDSVILRKETLPSQFKVDRPVSTAIYFLLPSGSVSKLHRIPSSEVWHFYAGDPLTVLEIHDNGEVKQTVIGPDLAAGQKLQYTVQPMVWFGAFPTKDLIDTTKCVKASPRDSDKNFSLVGCTVAPGFEFQDFVMGESEELKKLFPHLADVIEYLT